MPLGNVFVFRLKCQQACARVCACVCVCVCVRACVSLWVLFMPSSVFASAEVWIDMCAENVLVHVCIDTSLSVCVCASA